VFVSYSHEDKALKEMFDINLKVLTQQGLITTWTDKNLRGGDVWNDIIEGELRSADIVLFMVSNAFLASDFIRAHEVRISMELEAEKKALIVPVILKHCGWREEKWAGKQPLPSLVRAVTDWEEKDREKGFGDVEKGLRELIKWIQRRKSSAPVPIDPPGQVGGQIPPPPTPRRSEWWKPAAAGAAFAVLATVAWFGWQGAKSRQSQASQPTPTPGPPVEKTPPAPAPTVKAPTASLVLEDGKTPLAGQVIPALRDYDPMHGEGLAFNVALRHDGSLSSQSFSYELRYVASAGSAAPPPQPSSAIILGPGASTPNLAGWMQAFPLTNEKPWTHFSRWNYGLVPPVGMEGGQVAQLKRTFLYVGKGGSIPKGRHKVQLICHEQSGGQGAVIAKADFEIEAPEDWTMDPKDMKIRLLNAQGTAPLDAKPVVVLRNGPAANAYIPAANPQSITIPFIPEVAEEDVIGPVTIHVYALDAQLADASPRVEDALALEKSDLFNATTHKATLPQGEVWCVGESDGWLPAGVPAKRKSRLVPGVFRVDAGPKGNIPLGDHEFGVVLERDGKTIYRAKIPVRVTDEWAFPGKDAAPEDCRLQVLGADGAPIAGRTIPAQRAAPHSITNPATGQPVKCLNGLMLDWQLEVKGQPIQGPVSISYYLKAVKVPAIPSGVATMAVACQWVPDGLPAGFTSVFNWPQLAAGAGDSWQVGKVTLTDLPLRFYVDAPDGTQGSIPANTHEVGIEIVGKDNVMLYRNVVKLKVE
jgi:hypothetical protein